MRDFPIETIEQLKAEIDLAGGKAAFARRAKMCRSYFTNLINGHCGIGERAMFNIERATDGRLPVGKWKLQ